MIDVLSWGIRPYEVTWSLSALIGLGTVIFCLRGDVLDDLRLAIAPVEPGSVPEPVREARIVVARAAFRRELVRFALHLVSLSAGLLATLSGPDEAPDYTPPMVIVLLLLHGMSWLTTSQSILDRRFRYRLLSIITTQEERSVTADAGQRLAEAGRAMAHAGEMAAEAGRAVAEAGQAAAEAGQERAEAGQERAEAGQDRAEAGQDRAERALSDAETGPPDER
jgi:hypothetical protein